MREKLYWTIEKFSFRYDYFMFFDTTPYLANQLFIRHQVRVWFDSEYAKEGAPYASQAKNRSIFLKQADLSSKLLVWFEENIDNLTKELMQLSVK